MQLWMGQPRSRGPDGIAIWILSVGFSLILAVAVFITTVAARWQSVESQLHLALTSAVRTAVAYSYASESATSLQVSTSQFTQDLEQAALSELSTASSVTGCVPVPGVPATCSTANGATWVGIPVATQLAQNGVVDLGVAPSGSGQFTVALVLNPPPVWGIQAPLGSSQVATINLGNSTSVQQQSSGNGSGGSMMPGGLSNGMMP
ncbi:MAG: hypothetical protein C7B47_17200 [Sulfobacillus thermosulfidooxidans]|uniref:Uncharacterized protein n=1 Tax=Sulfobacillus thermosulfidooxidans TaxID=28034 RepID=A0A2T2WHB1_SULTH|nr:MAG: hypothetical protein C7B47_17200 [Sulfobacillus thermosulfidooxidans]